LGCGYLLKWVNFGLVVGGGVHLALEWFLLGVHLALGLIFLGCIWHVG